VQQVSIEPHVVVTIDEDDRLVIRTSTQVPFHARRQLAPVLGLPIKRSGDQTSHGEAVLVANRKY
jgi:putative selenate reductase molybdopterin-binding subunit